MISGGVLRFLVAQVIFFGHDDVAVLSREADGLAPVVVDETDDFLVHLAHQHHLDDVHGFPVRHPHPLDKTGFLPQFFQETPDLGPAAMDDHGVHPDVFHHDHVEGEILFQILVHHGVAAVLDDDGLVVKPPDIRQGLEKNVGPVHDFLDVFHVQPSMGRYPLLL